MSQRILFPSIRTALSYSPFFIKEAGLGIWLSTADPHLLTKLKTISLKRTAIHIPSEDRHRFRLNESQIASYLELAQRIGLTNLSKAVGYWTHEDSSLQKETVQIAWTLQALNEAPLKNLAQHILQDARQAAVAYELNGVVYHLNQ